MAKPPEGTGSFFARRCRVAFAAGGGLLEKKDDGGEEGQAFSQDDAGLAGCLVGELRGSEKEPPFDSAVYRAASEVKAGGIEENGADVARFEKAVDSSEAVENELGGDDGEAARLEDAEHFPESGEGVPVAAEVLDGGK